MIIACIVRPNQQSELSILGESTLKIYRYQNEHAEIDKVTITRKPQGHLVVAHQHLEKWVLHGFQCQYVDLSSFSHKWSGCFITLIDTMI